ncbi:hypothetical protein [Laspinema palackyanum]
MAANFAEVLQKNPVSNLSSVTRTDRHQVAPLDPFTRPDEHEKLP